MFKGLIGGYLEPTASVHVVVERKIAASARDKQGNPQPFISSVFAKFRKANTSFVKPDSMSHCLSCLLTSDNLAPLEEV